MSRGAPCGSARGLRAARGVLPSRAPSSLTRHPELQQTVVWCEGQRRKRPRAGATAGVTAPKERSLQVRVLGYARVSTSEQADSRAGLEAQRRAVEVECERRGWELVEVIEDAGYSAK